MITVLQEPEEFMPGYNDQVFVVTSDHKTEQNFRYIADIYIQGTGTYERLKLFPDPTYGNAAFPVGRIVENFISHDIEKNLHGFQQNINSYSRYSVKFGEEYGLSSSGTTVYPNQVTTNTFYAWNGILDHFGLIDYQNASQNPYIAHDDTTKFLTDAPSSGVIRSNEDAWLYMMANISNGARRMHIVTYDVSGNIIQTFEYQNPYRNLLSTNDRFLRFGCGTRNLNLLDSSGVVTGSLPVITDSVDRYSVTLHNVIPTTETKWYLIRDTCTRSTTYRFHFLNAKGGFDSFTFIRGSKVDADITRSKYKKLVGGLTSSSTYGYSKKDRGSVQYNTVLKDGFKVKSDWIKEDVCTWLEQLVSSPEVYLDDPDHGLVPVNILNKTYEFKQDSQEKLINLELEWEYAFDRYRQRG